MSKYIVTKRYNYEILRPFTEDYYQDYIGQNVNFEYVKEYINTYSMGNFHYIGDFSDEWDMVENLSELLKRRALYWKELDNRYGDELPAAPLDRSRNFTSTGDGVGEISPINSIIGEINTPSSKTKTDVRSSDFERDPKLVEESYEINTFKIKSLTEIVAHDIANLIIEELNSYY